MPGSTRARRRDATTRGARDMPCRRSTTAILLLGMAAGPVPAAPAQTKGQAKVQPKAQEKAQGREGASPEADREIRFLQGLRERGYHDLANEYIDRLAQDPAAPADLKAVLEYESGRGLLD